MKIRYIIFMAIAGLISCQKKNYTPEYFQFDVNGEHKVYVQGDRKIGDNTYLGIVASALRDGTGSCIYGQNMDRFPMYEGSVSFYLPKTTLSSHDTFIIDGVLTKAIVRNFYKYEDRFDAGNNNSGTGKIIITQSLPNRLEGIFEFDAYSATDTSVMHITNGKFSISR